MDHEVVGSDDEECVTTLVVVILVGGDVVSWSVLVGVRVVIT